ncbi:MAG: diacylglycerol kinase [Paracoccaceae bacterium]|jgi:diacylglycerol kinase (ATP)|nr:diacylglycerol kinase [Paracoccaceae bacterium]
MIYFLKRLKMRCIWSWQGTIVTWREEHSFRTWVWANLLSAIAALSLPLSTSERALILALGILVLAAELINTGIENAVDQISLDEHPLAKKAKDAGSAGVAVTAIAAGVAWLVILIAML